MAIAITIAIWSSNDQYSSNEIPESIETNDSIYFSFTSSQKSQLDDYFSKSKTNSAFNGVFLVGQKDSIFYSNKSGYSTYSKKDSFNLNSTFQLASVSKQFTAVAILKLYQEGKLKLSDSIQKFIPEIPYSGITIQQMLCHRSGLPNYHYFFQHIRTTYDTLLSNEDVVAEINIKKPNRYFSPNRKFQYSNTGYALLATIVERISKQSFSQYMTENIFNPLGMKNTFLYRADPNEVYPERTSGYIRRWRLAEDNYLDGVLGDKGAYSSAYDLFLWDQGLYKGIIIDPDTLNLAFQPNGRPERAKVNYGYGWRMYYYGSDSIKVNFHFGWWHGFRSLIMRIPQDSTTVISLKNRNAGRMMNTKSIMKILYPYIDTTNTKVDSLPSSEISIQTPKGDL